MNRINGLSNTILNPYAAQTGKKQPGSAMQKSEDVRAKLRELTQNRQSVYDGFSSSTRGNLLINATLDYGKTIREQRMQNKDSLLQIKSVKYQFKNISSQIIRAKTSTSARQAVGSAEREVMRLKRERMKEGVDETEINAAINHAKAMERVARRKVKHLLQEEMAEATGGKGIDISEEEIDTEKLGNKDIQNENTEALESVEQMNELSEEMLYDISKEMQELMEETGLSELSEVVDVSCEDMEPEDIKMLKIKHRNKEMKDITKADSEYLKVIFDHLQALKSEAASVSSAMSGVTSESSIDVAL